MAVSQSIIVSTRTYLNILPWLHFKNYQFLLPDGFFCYSDCFCATVQFSNPLSAKLCVSWGDRPPQSAHILVKYGCKGDRDRHQGKGPYKVLWDAKERTALKGQETCVREMGSKLPWKQSPRSHQRTAWATNQEATQLDTSEGLAACRGEWDVGLRKQRDRFSSSEDSAEEYGLPALIMGSKHRFWSGEWARVWPKEQAQCQWHKASLWRAGRQPVGATGEAWAGLGLCTWCQGWNCSWWVKGEVRTGLHQGDTRNPGLAFSAVDSMTLLTCGRSWHSLHWRAPRSGLGAAAGGLAGAWGLRWQRGRLHHLSTALPRPSQFLQTLSCSTQAQNLRAQKGRF